MVADVAFGLAGRSQTMDAGEAIIFFLEVPTWIHPDLEAIYTAAAFDATLGSDVHVDVAWRVVRTEGIAELRFNVRRPRQFSFAVGYDLTEEEHRRVLIGLHQQYTEGRPVMLSIFRTADDVARSADALIAGDGSLLDALSVGIGTLDCGVLARVGGYDGVDLGPLDPATGMRITSEEDRDTTLWWLQGVADVVAARTGHTPTLDEISDEASTLVRAPLRFHTDEAIITTSLAEMGREAKRPSGWMAARIAADRNQGLYTLDDDGTYGIDPTLAAVMDLIMRRRDEEPPPTGNPPAGG